MLSKVKVVRVATPVDGVCTVTGAEKTSHVMYSGSTLTTTLYNATCKQQCVKEAEYDIFKTARSPDATEAPVPNPSAPVRFEVAHLNLAPTATVVSEIGLHGGPLFLVPRPVHKRKRDEHYFGAASVRRVRRGERVPPKLSANMDYWKWYDGR